MQVEEEIEETLQVVYNLFREHGGEWPNFDYIQRWLSRFRQLDANQIVASIPDTLMKPLSYIDGQPDPLAKMVLSVEGVARCRGSDDDIHNFLGALQFLVQWDNDYDAPRDRTEWRTPISTKKLADELRLPLVSDSNSLARLIALLAAEDLISEE
jgi:hypothetical protein